MMEAHIFEWLQMLLRWLHVLTAIAWIGASFYFVWLDNSLEKPVDPELKAKGVDGELWAVHGGGFYNPQKYLVAPKSLPEHLHWFYWESYATWLSGFALFAVLYLWQAKLYLVDPQVLDLAPSQAGFLALLFLLMGWLGYDALCRIFGFRHRKLGLALALWVVALSFAANAIFAPRAAFLIVGASLATMMSGNVFFWIIPGQRKVIAAMREGFPPDPIHGQRGKQRSVHNTYLTLPVLFCMLSNHFAPITQHPMRSWLLILMMLAGVMLRQHFILRHKRSKNIQFLVAGSLLLLLIVIFTAPSQAPALSSNEAQVTREEAFAIVSTRCTGCHATVPKLIAGGPPKGILLETPSQLEAQAAAVYQQAVSLKIMPIGNLTQMTEEERTKLGQWIQSLSSLPSSDKP